MVGIVSYGAYIPIYRLSLETIGAAWGKPVGRGEKAIANADEDSITMAVEAVIDCLTGREREVVDRLYLASTTTPYREKQSASIVRAATDLREEIVTVDITNSLRGMTSAIDSAVNSVKAGVAKNVMVVASDNRIPTPNSEFEPIFGDGSAAFLIGDTDVAVSIEGSYSLSSEFLDVWRKEVDSYPMAWEDRFIREEGYEKIIPMVVQTLMKNYGVTPKDFTKAVYYGPDAKIHNTLAKKMGFDPKTQVQSPMFNVIGNTGCALAPMMLVAALEEAKPGDKILFVTYGDGADAYILQVTDQIEKIRDRRGIKRHLDSKMMITAYGKYLQMRHDIVNWGAEIRPLRRSSLPFIWRDRKMVYALYGQKCKSCGNIQYPKQRVCMYCQTKDNFEPIRLSDKTGRIFTFSKDERAAEIILPKVIAIVDIDGGGRFYTSLTDRDADKVDWDMPVEFTFRMFLDGTAEGSGFRNYMWRARPIRC
ncbi:hydroxymethylglutaryl-CoA synthase [Chloroflexota bacterium]